ncbi:hypothetical protein DYB31_014861 [Aphanomyces astaci]|uniref:DDE-1 domain-containing protein n=1 Tax=Aphanomyces astaci TaxID=112090 RepID=A0A397F2B3_APHAT|nr:hypothetical protein DYB31_014861 [Aphanomyces astaci]
MGGLRIACCGFHYRRELDSAAVVYMRALTTTHPILCIKANQREWLNNYLATKQQLTSYDSLLRLLQRFCDHHSFSRQRPTKNKVKQADLAEAEAPKSCHSLRMTAVLMVRADSTKLLILFIMKGVPGVRIDSGELSMFPPGHHYAVQERAWKQDKRVWATYLRDVLGEAVEEPSVVLLDNFESHVSGESYNINEEVRAHLCLLPPNATSVSQPLDVGVIGAV